MTLKNLRVILLIALTINSFGAFSQTFQLKTDSVQVNFDYVQEKTAGSISKIEADLEIDFKNFSKSKLIGRANVASLTTNNRMRDKHLKSKDFFNAAEFPEMIFEAKSFYQKDKQFFMKGNLTIKDITKEVVFEVIPSEKSLKFTTNIYAHDFDVAIKKDRSKSLVEIEIVVFN